MYRSDGGESSRFRQKTAVSAEQSTGTMPAVCSFVTPKNSSMDHLRGDFQLGAICSVVPPIFIGQ